MVYGFLLLCSFALAQATAREDPLRFFGKSIFFAQSVSHGVGSISEDFALFFAQASVFWSAPSGSFYFEEARVAFKMMPVILLSAGIVLLVV